jgi:hypothetical protein
MARPKIVEFPMARPKIVRTAEEAAAVPLHLPIQVEVEIPSDWPHRAHRVSPAEKSPAEKMHEALEKLDLAKKETIRLAEIELAQAEQLVLAKKEQLRQLTYGDHRPKNLKTSLG